MKIVALSILAIAVTLIGLPFFPSALSAQNLNSTLSPLEPTVEDPDAIIDLLLLTDETSIQVINLLEQLTGKIILRRQDLPPTKINFNRNLHLTFSNANQAAHVIYFQKSFQNI